MSDIFCFSEKLKTLEAKQVYEFDALDKLYRTIGSRRALPIWQQIDIDKYKKVMYHSVTNKKLKKEKNNDKQ